MAKKRARRAELDVAQLDPGGIDPDGLKAFEDVAGSCKLSDATVIHIFRICMTFRGVPQRQRSDWSAQPRAKAFAEVAESVVTLQALLDALNGPELDEIEWWLLVGTPRSERQARYARQELLERARKSLQDLGSAVDHAHRSSSRSARQAKGGRPKTQGFAVCLVEAIACALKGTGIRPSRSAHSSFSEITECCFALADVRSSGRRVSADEAIKTFITTRKQFLYEAGLCD